MMMILFNLLYRGGVDFVLIVCFCSFEFWEVAKINEYNLYL